MPRPPIQHHKHIISFAPEVEEFLEKALDRVTIHKAIGAGGEALKGALSHPVGYLGIVVILVGIAVALKGGDKARSVQNIETGFLKLTPEEAEAFKNAVQGIAEFFGGIFQAPPPGEGAPLPPM